MAVLNAIQRVLHRCRRWVLVTGAVLAVGALVNGLVASAKALIKSGVPKTWEALQMLPVAIGFGFVFGISIEENLT